MKERLDLFLDKLDKSVVIRHAEQVMGQKLKLSEPFSAGQYWACFELVAGDGRLVIARVRLPKHPDTPNTVTKQSELYSIACEVTTMQFIKSHVPSVTIPEVYAYAGPGTDEAAKAGAVYMLIEGFYGNTLQDVEFDMTKLPVGSAHPQIPNHLLMTIEDRCPRTHHHPMDGSSGGARNRLISADRINLASSV